MLTDHENLLSTFGKDSESSNRKSRNIDYAVRSKRVSLNYDKQPKSRYQHILSQRKTLMLVQKYKQPTVKEKEAKKKLKTQTDIDYLNTRIRRSISGIAETINKSKVKPTKLEPQYEFQPTAKSIKKTQTIYRDTIHSQKNLKTFESKRPKGVINDKENININTWISNFDQSKGYSDKNLTRKEYLKNSTKKKRNILDSNNQCPIKSSFSIDLNSDVQSAFQSSRKRVLERNCSNFNLLNINQSREDYKILHSKQQSFGNKRHQVHISIGKEMQETLKKEFKQLAESNYNEHTKFLETKGTKNSKPGNQEFILYDLIDKQQKSPNFNNIEFPKQFTVGQAKKRLDIEKESINQKQHKLIESFMIQIQLDYDLRHAKHMFSGIEQPFYAARQNDERTVSKWQKLNSQLKNLGLFYSVDTIKKIFLPSQEQIDPFLSVSKPHDQLTYSLIYAYETAQIHWQQKIYQKWQHWDLRDIDLTIENIDRDRKGYITVEDIAAFISMQTGKEYKNRDVVLIYKRLVNGFWSRRSDLRETLMAEKDKHRLKFRSLIDSLIKPF